MNRLEKAAAWVKTQSTGLARLNGSEATLAVTLLDYVNVNGWAWPKLETLLEQSKLPRSTACRSLQGLERKGIIQRYPGAGIWFPTWPGVSTIDRDTHLRARKWNPAEPGWRVKKSQGWDQKRETGHQQAGTRRENMVPTSWDQKKDLSTGCHDLTNNNQHDGPKARASKPEGFGPSPTKPTWEQRKQVQLQEMLAKGVDPGMAHELHAMELAAHKRRQAYSERLARQQSFAAAPVAPKAEQAPPKPQAPAEAEAFAIPEWTRPILKRVGCTLNSVVGLLQKFGEDTLRKAYEVASSIYPTDETIRTSFGAILRRTAENGWTTRAAEVKLEKVQHEQKVAANQPPKDVVSATLVATGEVFDVLELKAHGLQLAHPDGRSFIVSEADYDKFAWMSLEAQQPQEAQEAQEAPEPQEAPAAELPEAQSPDTTEVPSGTTEAVRKADGLRLVILSVDGDRLIVRGPTGIGTLPRSEWHRFEFKGLGGQEAFAA